MRLKIGTALHAAQLNHRHAGCDTTMLTNSATPGSFPLLSHMQFRAVLYMYEEVYKRPKHMHALQRTLGEQGKEGTKEIEGNEGSMG